MKGCVSELWKHGCKALENEDPFVNVEVLSIPSHQQEEYFTALKDKKENAVKSKEHTAQQQREMIAYERKMGPIPPGA